MPDSLEPKIKLPPCPHCGKVDFIYVTGEWHGPAPHYFDEGGNYAEASTDKLYATLHKIIRCAACNKIRTDLILDDNPKERYTKVVLR